MKRGPPLLPGLMDGRLYEIVVSPAPMARALALTMAHRHGVTKSEGIAIATTYSPTLRSLPRSERGPGKLGPRLPIEHRQVETLVAADHLGRIFLLVGQLDFHPVRLVTTVGIGDDVAPANRR